MGRSLQQLECAKESKNHVCVIGCFSMKDIEILEIQLDVWIKSELGTFVSRYFCAVTFCKSIGTLRYFKSIAMKVSERHPLVFC